MSIGTYLFIFVLLWKSWVSLLLSWLWCVGEPEPEKQTALVHLNESLWGGFSPIPWVRRQSQVRWAGSCSLYIEEAFLCIYMFSCTIFYCFCLRFVGGRSFHGSLRATLYWEWARACEVGFFVELSAVLWVIAPLVEIYWLTLRYNSMSKFARIGKKRSCFRSLLLFKIVCVSFHNFE